MNGHKHFFHVIISDKGCKKTTNSPSQEQALNDKQMSVISLKDVYKGSQWVKGRVVRCHSKLNGDKNNINLDNTGGMDG